MNLSYLKNKILDFFFKSRLFIIKFYNKIDFPKKINVGGGSNFNEFGWLNYDINSLLNPLTINHKTNFPNKNNSINLIYSSHAFEHFSDVVIEKIFNESRRVLESRGHLLIIIPDYDFLIKKWQERDSSFFGQTTELGFNKSLHYWRNKNLEDNLNNRAAFMFCSYWNLEFEKKFRAFQSKSTNNYDPNIFWGPPSYDQDKLLTLLDKNSPKKVVDYLRNCVLEKNSDFIFCHQNAWSKNEMINATIKYGFNLIESDKEILKTNMLYSQIPGFFDHYELSNYFLFQKND